MATEESNIVQACRIQASKSGARLFRNNRGFFLTIDAIKTVKDAAVNFGVTGVLDVLKSGRLRKVRAGLEVPGSADLIGWKTIQVTPEMVGMKIAIFCGAEVKTLDGRVSKEQQIFIDNVNAAGGIAGAVRSPEEVHTLLSCERFIPKAK